MTGLRASSGAAAASTGVAPAGAASDASWLRMARCSSWSSAPGSVPSSSTSVAAGRGVGLQRVGLPARAVEREQQLGAEALAERVLGHELLELGHEHGVAAERELRVDAQLDRLQPQLAEMGGCGGDRLAGEVGERLAAPERERLVEQRHRLGRLGGAGRVDEAAELVEVELARLDAQHVAGRPRGEAVAQLRAQAQHVVLQRAVRGGGRLVAPDEVDQPLGRDDAVRIEEQRGRDGAPLRRRRAPARARRRRSRAARGSGTPRRGT